MKSTELLTAEVENRDCDQHKNLIIAMKINFKEQLEIGLNAAKKVKPVNPYSYSRIIFCGMGGSIMPAEAVSMLWLDNLNCYINRISYLPHWTAKEHLVICVSWSGNTKETISAYQQAKDIGAKTLAISNGGKLQQLAEQDGAPFVLLPNLELAPRNALLMVLSSLLTLISQSAIIKDNLNSSVFSETELKKKEETAKEIAEHISNKTPLLYSSYSWRFLGDFWKKFFNENCKIHSFFNFLPEAAHNEIAGIKKNDSNFFYILLKDFAENQEDIKETNKLEKFLKSYGTDYFVSEVTGNNRFEKIINQYILASLTSEALANKLGVNPENIETIESFKKLS